MTHYQSLSGELQVVRHHGGVQLLRPEKNNESPELSLAKLYQSSFGVYFMDANSAGVSCNTPCADMNNFTHQDDIIGITSLDYYERETALSQQHDDQQARAMQSVIISGQTAEFLNQEIKEYLTFKQPWYRNDKVVGILGITLHVNQENPSVFTQQINELMQTGLVNPRQHLLQRKIKNSGDQLQYFSPRELTILRHLVRGRTAKEIGLTLHISKRTVENHIQRMREKSSCASKFEMVEKYFEYLV